MPFRLGMPTLIEFAGLKQNVELCRELSFAFVELNMNLPWCTPQVLPVSQLQAYQEHRGVDFTVHLPEELDLASVQPLIRDGHIGCATEALRWAGDAGIRLAVMHLGTGVYLTLPDRKEFIYAREARAFRQRLVEGFDVVMQAAEDGGVRLCLENAGDWTVPFLQEALEQLLRRFPGLGLCYDVGHDAALGYVNETFFEVHANRLVHMHLHDAEPKADHRPLFIGSVDILGKLELARQRDMRVVVEVKTARALRQSAQALRERGICPT